MTIYFATDHAGLEQKDLLIKFVKEELDYDVVDCGAHSYDPLDDYPDFIHEAAKCVAESPKDRVAIIFGKSGNGEAMAANRHPGVRAAHYYGGALDIISLSREHNDANVLSLGAGFLSFEEMKEAITLWLKTDFTGEERHVRRIKKIDL